MTDTPKDSNTQEKKQKAKGPIRFEAIIPVTIVIILGLLYGRFFFDDHLRKGLEWTGTYLHGAEVNISDLDISLFNATFTLRGLQLTDKKKPEQNLVRVGRIHLGLLWDALLRAKLVVNEAAIEEIEVYSPRKSPGYVVPPKKQENTAIGEVKKKVNQQAKKELGGNVLGDVASVMGGEATTDKQISAIQGELQAEKKIQDVQKLVKEKEKEWKKRLNELPDKKELDALVQEAKSVKLDLNNPVQFAKDLKKLQKVVKNAEKKVKVYERANKDLKGDLSALDRSYKEIDQLIQQDLKDLQKRLKLPDLDVKSFSKNIFAEMIREKMSGLAKYMTIARKYMPPKKSKEEKQAGRLTPRARGAGEDVRYPITTGYPLFWLKKGVISSKASDSEYSGDVSGKITDVTSNPVALGKPARVEIKGDFPKQKILGLDALIEIDHTTEDPVERFTATVSSFPFGSQKLLDSKEARLNINEAKGASQMSGAIRGKKLRVDIQNKFTKVSYDVGAKDKTLNEILVNTTKTLPALTLDAKIRGRLDALRFAIDSNLGRELGKGIQAQVQAKIDQKKKELRRKLEAQIAGEKAKLEKQINQVKGQVNQQLSQTKQEIHKAKKTAQTELKRKEKRAKKSKGKELERKAKELLGF